MFIILCKTTSINVLRAKILPYSSNNHEFSIGITKLNTFIKPINTLQTNIKGY